MPIAATRTLLNRGRAAVLILGVVSILANPTTSESAEPKVSLSLDGASLTAVAAELTRQTGQTHRAVEGDRQMVTIYCRDQPALRVRRALSELLGWSWTQRMQNGAPRYTFIKGLHLQQEEKALRERFTRQYGAVVDSMIAAASAGTPPGENDSPLLAQARDPIHGSVLRSLGSLPEPVRARVLSGTPYVAQGSALSSRSRSALGALFETHAKNGGSTTRIEGTDTVRLQLQRDRRGRPSSLQDRKST